MNPLKIIKYGKYFSESRFLAFATRYGKKLAFVQKAVVLFFCLRDQDTPKYVKAILAGALGYSSYQSISFLIRLRALAG